MMRSIQRACLTVLVATATLAAPALADSLYTEESGGILSDRLGDRRSTLGPGALVTVVVNENMIASSGANTKTSKVSRAQASWNLGSILPRPTAPEGQPVPEDRRSGTLDLGGKTEFQGDGVTKRADTITLLVAATILEVLPDGSLRIGGKKNMRVNDEESTVEIAGVIRPYDIDEGNRIQSTKIANLKLDFKGTGTASAKAMPGLISRLFNWLF